MMNRSDARIIAGLLLVAAGVLLLLQNMGLLGIAWNALWAALFLAGGIAFLAIFFSDRGHWWPLIPGFVLLGLGILVGLETVDRGAASLWGGSIFLGFIGLAFLAVYLFQQENWWALIPGGVLLTLAAVAGFARGREGGTLFFLGLAATFALVYLAPGPLRRRGWALLTAAVLLALALVTAAATASAVNYVWPVLLILLGVYLVYRSLRSRRA